MSINVKNHCYSELNIMGTVGFVHLQSFTDTWQKKGQDISSSAAWNVFGLKKKEKLKNTDLFTAQNAFALFSKTNRHAGVRRLMLVIFSKPKCRLVVTASTWLAFP